MDEKIPLDELLFRGTGIGAIPPTRTWQERIAIKPKHYYLAEGTRIHKELEEKMNKLVCKVCKRERVIIYGRAMKCCGVVQYLPGYEEKRELEEKENEENKQD